MLFRNEVRDAAQRLLIAANTLAGSKVFTTRSQPLRGGEPPLLLIFSPKEEGTSLGPAGVPLFRTVMMLVIQPLVRGSDDGQCGEDIDLLCEQAVNTLLCSPEFLTMPSSQGGRAIEEVKFLHTMTTVEAKGEEFIGTGVIQIGLQYKDRYDPPLGVPLQQVSVTGDAVNLYSPTGIFTDVAEAGFPNASSTPSPRKSGPDGRAEISFVIPFQDQNTSKG